METTKYLRIPGGPEEIRTEILPGNNANENIINIRHQSLSGNFVLMNGRFRKGI